MYCSISVDETILFCYSQELLVSMTTDSSIFFDDLSLVLPCERIKDLPR
jgi:hypothetical protein